MSTRHLILGIATALVLAGCATREPMPFQSATDCFYPSCAVNVDVVDDGKGGKMLKASNDGIVRMGTRHKVVAIVWNLRTPGYQLGGDSITPLTHPSLGKPITSRGAWDRQIFSHPYWWDSASVTNMNDEREVLTYVLKVYPSRGTPGAPLTLDAAILNDPCPNMGTWCR